MADIVLEKSLENLMPLGVDIGAILNGLLSPSGVVNQFAITLSIQLFRVIGYVVSGIVFALLGGAVGPLGFFSFLLTPQVQSSILRALLIN